MSSDCDPNNLDFKFIIQKLLNPKSKHYRLRIDRLSCVGYHHELSVESVLESPISIYEYHFRDEDSIAEECQIAVSEPSLAHSYSAVYNAMSQYWSAKHAVSWHFTRTNKTFTSDELSVILQRLKQNRTQPED